MHPAQAACLDEVGIRRTHGIAVDALNRDALAAAALDLISMSGKGNCLDNSMVETFFKTLKSEIVWRTVFQTRAEATTAIARYIGGSYNPVRRHSALDFISPAQFE